MKINRKERKRREKKRKDKIRTEKVACDGDSSVQVGYRERDMCEARGGAYGTLQTLDPI